MELALSDSSQWRVGEPDDAENAAVMRIGIAARKSALKSFKEIPPIVKDYNPETDAVQLVAYQLQGMVQQAAYCAVLAQTLVDDLGMEWPIDHPKAKEMPTLERVLFEVGIIANLFDKRINNKENE